MCANIVNVSVIFREKLQFMYNFNRFVPFMPLLLRTTILKAVQGRNAKSLMQFTYCELLPKLVLSYPIFVLDKYIMFLSFLFLFLFFSCLYPEIIIQSKILTVP